MSGKSLGGATTAAERRERVDRALRLICDRGGSWQGLAVKLAAEFGCNYKTAKRYIREAKTLIGADLPEATQAMRAYIRGRLFYRIEHTKSEDVELRAIKQLTDLSGVSAPTRAEVLVTTPPPLNPVEAYANSPGLMERGLQFEEDLANATADEPATIPLHPGQNRIQGLEIPPAPPTPPAGGNGHVDKSGQEPDHRGDPGSAR